MRAAFNKTYLYYFRRNRKVKIKHILIVVLFNGLFSFSAIGQETILFQIPNSTAQIEYAQSTGDEKSVAEFKRSDKQIMVAIYRNFKAHFNFCPVYFFNSKDFEKVKNKNLSAVTFYNNKGEEVKLTNELKNYQIANISFFPKVVNKEVDNGVEVLKESAEDHFGRGIIMNSSNFNPVLGKMRFTPCKIFKRGSIFNKKKRYYEFRGAEALNRKLHRHGIQVKSTQ